MNKFANNTDILIFYGKSARLETGSAPIVTADLSRLPTRFEDFVTTLRRRHAAIIESRADKGPGSQKA